MLLIKWQHIFQKHQIKQNSVRYLATIVTYQKTEWIKIIIFLAHYQICHLWGFPCAVVILSNNICNFNNLYVILSKNLFKRNMHIISQHFHAHFQIIKFSCHSTCLYFQYWMPWFNLIQSNIAHLCVNYIFLLLSYKTCCLNHLYGTGWCITFLCVCKSYLLNCISRSWSLGNCTIVSFIESNTWVHGSQ